MLTRSIKRLAGHTLLTSPLTRFLLRHAGVVVAFHRVQPTSGPSTLTIGVREFEHYCEFFRRCFRVIPLSEVLRRLEQGRSLERTLAISFDDGYQDNFKYAAPILERLSLPATFFIVTKWMGTAVVPWWDRQDNTQFPWMTWDEVRSLQSRGFEIGGHTQTHVDLGVAPRNVVRHEVFGTRHDLDRELGARPRAFAYPYGRRDNITEESRGIVREAGFTCCCSAFGGINGPGDDPFRLVRVPIGSDVPSPQEFGFEVALGRTLLRA
jgi:peptidoglycan/xylan/chitin deacetylase (PgdA/CDA1 family)